VQMLYPFLMPGRGRTTTFVRHSDSMNDQSPLTRYQTLVVAAVFLNVLAHRADGSFLFAYCQLKLTIQAHEFRMIAGVKNLELGVCQPHKFFKN
jgi:hypothetical protein